jgi:hypothetical protein
VEKLKLLFGVKPPTSGTFRRKGFVKKIKPCYNHDTPVRQATLDALAADFFTFSGTVRTR